MPTGRRKIAPVNIGAERSRPNSVAERDRVSFNSIPITEYKVHTAKFTANAAVAMISARFEVVVGIVIVVKRAYETVFNINLNLSFLYNHN